MNSLIAAPSNSTDYISWTVSPRHSDLTAQSAAFGTVVDFMEMDDLAALRRQVEPAEIDQMLQRIETEFDIQPDCEPAELRRAATTAVALFKLVETHQIGSMAYFYVSVPGHEHEDIISSVILGCSMLTAVGVPVAGEYEIKNA